MKTENEAADALENFAKGPAITAADDVAKAFEFAGERIALALQQAARSGELSFNSLAESILQDFARTAITDLFTKPLQQAIGGIGSSIGNSIAGGSAKPSVNVNMTVAGVSNVQDFKKSQGQITAGLARAVATGQRYT